MSLIYPLIPLIIIFINIFFLWFLWPLAKKQSALRWYQLIIIIVSVWQGADFVSRLPGFTISHEWIWYSWRLAYGFITFMGYSIYRFILSFLKLPAKRWVQYGFWGWCSGVAILGIFTDTLSAGVTLKFWGLDSVPGEWYGLFMATIAGFFVLDIALLIRAYWQTDNPPLKKQYRLLIIGFSIAFLSGSVTDLLTPLLGIEFLPLGGIGTVIFLVTILIANFTFRFLDIRFRYLSIRSKITAGYLVVLAEIILIGFLGYYYSNAQALTMHHLIEWHDARDDAPTPESQEEKSEKLMLIAYSATLDQRNKLMGMLTSLIVLSGIGVVFVTSRIIITPLTQLEQQIKTFSGKNLETPLDIHRQDELGSLARAFQRMRERLKMNLESLEDQVTKKTQALQTQVFSEQKMNEAMVFLLDRSKKTNRLLTKREQELKRANLKLKRLDELKSNFLSNVSHELRTPLTAIKMYNQLLLDGILGSVEPRQKEALRTILQSADNLVQIVNDLLDLKKMEAGRMEYHFKPDSIVPVLEEVQANLKALLLQSQTPFELRLSQPLPLITIDRQRLIQVIENLVGNATKFNPKHRPVVLKAEVEKNTERRWLKIAVIDHGIGIQPDDLKRLFNKFYQVDAALTRETKGSGLGLAISKEIVLAHQGKLTVSSTYGRGSTFTVWLPLAKTS